MRSKTLSEPANFTAYEVQVNSNKFGLLFRRTPITSLIGGMQLFDVPATLSNGNGDPRKAVLTTSMYLYNQGFKNHNYGYAAAISTGLFVIIGILSIFSFKAMKKKGEEV